MKINLAKFFTWTGAFLIVVAAGVLGYGFHDLQEAGILPGLNNLAFDVSGTIDEGSWYGAVLKGVFNFSPRRRGCRRASGRLYLVVTMTFFLRGVRRRGRPPAQLRRRRRELGEDLPVAPSRRPPDAMRRSARRPEPREAREVDLRH